MNCEFGKDWIELVSAWVMLTFDESWDTYVTGASDNRDEYGQLISSLSAEQRRRLSGLTRDEVLGLLTYVDDIFFCSFYLIDLFE